MDLSLEKLPKHLGIIIDGNGRWAKQRGMPRSFGHKMGLKNLEKILKECFYSHKIPIVSVFAFSSENWGRPKEEVDYLMDLFRDYLSKNFIHKYEDVKLNVIGDINGLPEDIAIAVSDLMLKTKHINKFTLNLAINYSGQEEIINACNQIIISGEKHVDKNVFESYLYTKGQPPIDFIIRTSGEQRLSNFMLWQAAYAEFYFPKKHWPGFNKGDLRKAFIEFQGRDRRYGKIKQ